MKEITIDDVKNFLNSMNVKIDMTPRSGVATYGRLVKTSTVRRFTSKSV